MAFYCLGILRIAASGIRQCHSLPICFLASDLTNSQSETRSKELWLWDELACLSGMNLFLKTTAMWCRLEMGHILFSKNCQMICFNFSCFGIPLPWSKWFAVIKINMIISLHCKMADKMHFWCTVCHPYSRKVSQKGDQNRKKGWGQPIWLAWPNVSWILWTISLRTYILDHLFSV